MTRLTSAHADILSVNDAEEISLPYFVESIYFYFFLVVDKTSISCGTYGCINITMLAAMLNYILLVNPSNTAIIFDILASII